MVAIGNALRHVPTAQAALALATTGTGLAWSLFLPGSGEVIRGFCAFIGACLLMPVLLKYLLSPQRFIQDLRHPLYGSLMAPMTMTMLVLADYLSSIHIESARLLWYPALMLHFAMLSYFFSFQIRRFRLTNLYPSWFLYPVGAISGTLAGPQLGHTEFAITMTNTCVGIYFVMLPLVLYRLCFAGRLPRPARPTLAIMAAPVNLSLTAYLLNVEQPDPVLTGALAGVGITMTILVYLCYFNLLKQRFQPSLAAVTFPSVISAVAIERLTQWLVIDFPHWAWLGRLGLFELTVATGLVMWVGWSYIGYYWPKARFSKQPST
ncbi:tellurium resistance protein [Photobacterium proteolyticum]|uniref:Tellurium resistance protein n=1 Tax=Photobacterium proteolyticum TaxID=1903952 RepID=A0A1Q9GFL2_9GAMM|nr:TDT family transporter [Photobacterium proteolyticum]OLQ73175.1 tellurium resistance protein [Photobacterium proteolyticum]